MGGAWAWINKRWKPYVELVKALAEANRLLTVVVMIGAVVRALAPVGFVVGFATVISQVPETVRNGLGSDAGRVLQLALLGTAIAFLVQQVMPAVQQSAGFALGNKFNALLQQRLMRATLRPPGIGHLEEPQLQNEILAATRGLSGFPRPDFAPTALAGRISVRLTFAGACLVLAVFHWWLALPILISGLWLQSQIVRSLTADVQAQIGVAAAQRRSVYFRDLAVTPPAAKEIRIFGLARWLINRYTESFDQAMVSMRDERQRGRGTLYASTLAICASVAGTLILMGWEAGHGGLTLAEVALVIQALMTAVPQLSENQVAVDGLALDFTLKSIATAAATENRLAHVPVELSGTTTSNGLPRDEIRFEDVWFRYPGQDRDVLQGVNLAIPAGHSLAIVGANGAGKTTMIKLLCRLYEPTKGRITVDGVDLREIEPSGWQRRIAAIFQDYVKYPLSASDNIIFGGLHRGDDRALLDRTAAKVGIASHIDGLPSGWHTTLSREYEGGVDLSGGEWQRVALARALFAAGAGASVLILDEPTANLDVRGEAEIYGQFLELTERYTTLLISHRFSTVRRAERICVLEDGQVVEEGSHDSLLEARGRYAELFRLQAARFGDDDAAGLQDSEVKK